MLPTSGSTEIKKSIKYKQCSVVASGHIKK